MTLLLLSLILFACKEKALIEAFERDDLVEAEKLLKNGANPNFSEKYNVGPIMNRRGGCSSIFAAALVNDNLNFEKMQLLVKYGLNIKNFSTCNKKENILAGPVYWKKPKILKLLLDHGADVNYQDEKGYDALGSAVVANNVEMVKILLQAGANPNLADNLGETAIFYALKNIDIFKMLLEAGADINHNVEQEVPPNINLLTQVDFFQEALKYNIDLSYETPKTDPVYINYLHIALRKNAHFAIPHILKQHPEYFDEKSKGKTMVEYAKAKGCTLCIKPLEDFASKHRKP